MLKNYKRKTKPAPWTMIYQEPQTPKLPWRPKRSKKIALVSKRQASKKARYRAEAQEFVNLDIQAGNHDEVIRTIPELRDGRRYGWPVSDKLNEVHHFYGRLGQLLMAKWGWFSRSKAGHRWIHEHIDIAREHDWICQPGQWNDYEAALADAVKRGWAKPDGTPLRGPGVCRLCGFAIHPECHLCGECACEEEGCD